MTTNSKHTNQNHSHPSRAGMSTALVLGLAVLAVAVVVLGASGVNQAHAYHCSDSNIIGLCKDRPLNLGIGIVNATLYPVPSGDVLEMWLKVKPRPEPHNAAAIDYIIAYDNKHQIQYLQEYCVQYKGDKPVKWFTLEDDYLKTCFFISNSVGVDGLKDLYISYVLEVTDSFGKTTETHYHKSISLADVDFQRYEHPNTSPMMCEAPSMTTRPTDERTEPEPPIEDGTDEQQPYLMAAAYHKIFGELVLSFDENITLMDGWQDNITVGGVLVGETAKNRMVGASSLAWISVDYTTKNNIRDAHSQAITIEAGTFMDADGNANDRIIIQAALTG